MCSSLQSWGAVGSIGAEVGNFEFLFFLHDNRLHEQVWPSCEETNMLNCSSFGCVMEFDRYLNDVHEVNLG